MQKLSGTLNLLVSRKLYVIVVLIDSAVVFVLQTSCSNIRASQSRKKK